MSQVVPTQFRAMFDQVLMLHREAMTARDVEDLLRFTRIFYHTMVEQMAEEQDNARLSRRTYTADDALSWESNFKELLAVFDAGNHAIERMDAPSLSWSGRRSSARPS